MPLQGTSGSNRSVAKIPQDGIINITPSQNQPNVAKPEIVADVSSSDVPPPIADMRVYQNNWLLRQFVDVPDGGRPAVSSADIASSSPSPVAQSSYDIRARADSGDAPHWQASWSIGSVANDDPGIMATAAQPNLQPPNYDQLPSDDLAVNDTMAPPLAPTKRRRLSATVMPRLVHTNQPHVNNNIGNTSAMCRMDDTVFVNATLGQETSHCASSIGQLLNQNITNIEEQFQSQMDGYQRSMDHALAVHSRNMLHTKQRLARCNGRLRELETTIETERSEYRACMEQAEVE